MKKRLMLVVVTVLAAASSAHAQTDTDPLGRPSVGVDTVRSAQRDPDPARREDRLISVAERGFSKMEEEARSSHVEAGGTVKAMVAVTNHTSKVIKSVSWAASFTDPGTGQLIRKYDVSTGARIQPGKTKTLTKRLPIPRVKVVSAAAPVGHKAHDTFAKLTSAVTGVTYDDGSTFSAP
ncbi:MAG: hypothetical protein DMF66_16750 [Acidobacteria bacterium]|nr:MAG: hypothetical protein DMF66_16750 [Acidobacteriota bacterium]